MLEVFDPEDQIGGVRLREYQVDAIRRLLTHIQDGLRRIVIVAPTGSGKTTIAGSIITHAACQGLSVLFIAHRRELINQAYDRMLQMGLAEDNVGVIMASDSRRRPGARLQVASIDTLRNRPKPKADIVFIDEAHRAPAASYRAVVDQYPQAIHLGLTATPIRADGKGLADIYQSLLEVSSIRSLIDQGHLVLPRIFTVAPSDLPQIKHVRMVGGDYNEADLEAVVNTKKLVGNIVEHWMQHAKDVRTVAFATSVKHSKHICERFRESGVAAEHLDGKTPKIERDAILKRLETGETLVVCNCGVLCEGWDQPAVKCAILARPTASTALYIQQAGRILRPSNGQRAIILDHAGCVHVHGLIDQERPWSLEGTPKREKEPGFSEPPVKFCPQCFCACAKTLGVCPECGFTFTKNTVLRETFGQLIEFDPAASRQYRTWKQLALKAQKTQQSSSWVDRQFKRQFGTPPPKHFYDELAVDLSIENLLLQAAHSQQRHVSWDQLDKALSAS